MTLRSVIRNVPYAVRAPCQPVMPEFLEEPVRQVCAGRPIELATIVRGTYGDDSLFVDWGKPVQEGPNGLQTDPFRPGYGFRKPFPDTTFNSSNVAAVMDSSTGIIRFTSHVIGDFTFALRVQRYRNGFWVSDNFREMLLRVVPNCDSLPGGATAYNDAPDLGVYHIGDTLVNPTVILEFVCVGDTVRLKFKAEDLDLDGNGVPQQLRLVAKGFAPDVDSGYYHMDCVNHNCAELTPVPNSSTSVSGQLYELSWVVPHVASYGTYTNDWALNRFSFLIIDDHCPNPGFRYLEYKLFVKRPPRRMWIWFYAMQPGLQQVGWISPGDTLDHFNGYHIYKRMTPQDPYQLIHIETDYQDTLFTHYGTMPDEFVVSTVAGRCGAPGLYSDTIRSHNLSAYYDSCGTRVDLSWRNQYGFAQTTPWTLIHGECDGITELVASTNHLSTTDYTHCSNVTYIL